MGQRKVPPTTAGENFRRMQGRYKAELGRRDARIAELSGQIAMLCRRPYAGSRALTSLVPLIASVFEWTMAFVAIAAAVLACVWGGAWLIRWLPWPKGVA